MNSKINTTDPHLKASFGTVTEVTKTVEIPVGSENDYEKLVNKPRINARELVGDKSFEDLGLQKITNRELEAMFD